MAVSPGPTLVVCILICFGPLNSSPLDSCPDFCTCEQFLQPNCSSAGLSWAPQDLHTSVSALDLSNNQLGALTFKSKYYSLQKVWLGNNSIVRLSLCVDLDLTNRGRSRLRRSFGPWRRSGCLLWAPTLQLLSAERNQLQTLPEGLGQQRELQILNLSFNKISKLKPEDFANLKQLEELHLQNNLIAFLQPQIFEKLDKLKVLDLSFNLLTTLHPSTYMSLRDFGTDVALRGNSWICDCNMRVLQRWMAVDVIRGLKTWSIECASPVSHSGMNLLELQEDDFECPDQELHKDITVHKGSRILLACSESDAVWWTPNGQTTGSQYEGGLLVTDITEQDEGLYVCISHSNQILSIFNVQIREKTRKSRSVPGEIPYSLDKMVRTNNTVAQSHFAMAVSLSVIITFIVAFILGVLLQPYICACWQKTQTRKQKPQTTTTSVANAREEQYDNEAYLHCEDVDDFEPHRERRVTFTEYTEEGNMQYYDTVAGDVEEANGAVTGHGQVSSESSDESGSEDGKRNRKNFNNLGKKTEFEHIPDSSERNSLSSQSSNSSKEDKILKNNCSTPNTSQIAEERVQRTEVATIEVSQIESRSEIPGFSSEPFADWSPHQHGSSLMTPDPDNGDPFEFSDSVRSGSPISPSSLNGSFKQPNLLVPNVNKKIRFKSSSSSSEMSDGEPTQYTVNADSEEEAEVFEKNLEIIKASKIVKSSKSSFSSSESETESHHAMETRPVVDLASEKMAPHMEQKPPTPKRRAPLPTPRREPSSSSSDSEDEIQELKQENTQVVTKQETKNVHFEQQSSWPVDLELVGKVKRRLDFKVRYAAYVPFSSSDSEDERIYEEIKEEDGPKLPIYSKEESSVATTDIKPQSGTSSSSESEEEQENYYENIHLETSPRKPPVGMLEQEPKWPVVSLVKIPKVKKRLDFKMAVPTIVASSSSDSEDEQLYVNVTQVQGKVPLGVVNVSKPGSGTSSSSESEDEREIKVKVNKENLQQTSSPIKPPTAVKLEQSQWPVINLVRIPKLKRRLEVKERVNIKVTPVSKRVPSTSIKVPKYGTSSSSESEDEREIKVKVNKENLQQTSSPIKPPTAVKLEESQWPVINLVRIPKLKRRLEVKERVNIKVTPVSKRVPLTSIKVPKYGTSSSSESEDEREIKIATNNLQQIAPPAKQPSIESPWPVIDLGRIRKVKRRLDVRERMIIKVTPLAGRVPSTSIKVPKSYSGTSSSSESDDKQEIHKEKLYKEKIQIVTTPNRHPTESQWPMINSAKVPKVKRRLDIKTTAPVVDSSSSSDSEDERVYVNVTTVQGKLPSATVNVQKPDSGTSSSSESEDEQNMKIVTKENLQQIAPPAKQPSVESPWPVIDLVRIPKVKRCLDVKERVHGRVTQVPERLPSTIIKIPKPESGTSSSSESEDEQKINEQKLHQEKIQTVTTPKRQPSGSQWPVIDLVNVLKVKRRLDIKERINLKVALVPERVPSTSIKVPKQDSGTSSSSESEDEQEIKIATNNLQQIALPAKQPSVESPWPVIDLVRIPKVKRCLDVKERVHGRVTQVPERVPSTIIKIPKPESGTSSSSESEDEQKINEQKLHQEKIQTITTPNRQPSGSQWPVIDLVNVLKVKRRLDIKERINLKVALVPERVPSTSIKVPKQDSGTSSSSESEDEQEIKIATHNLQQIAPPAKQPSVESPWPVIDLVRIPKVKRCLDVKERVHGRVTRVPERVPSTIIKIPKPESGTSSSSESEDEQKIKEQKLLQEKIQTVMTPNRQPSGSQWPVIDLVTVPKVKRRLDIKERINLKVALVPERVPSTSIKVPKQDSGTSSSSESEDEQEIKIATNNLQQIAPPAKQPSVESPWPVIDLVRIPKVKRCLDVKERVHGRVTRVPERVPSTIIKIPKPESGTSSSSESEDEQKIKEQKLLQEKIQTVMTPNRQPSGSQWPVIDLVTVPKVKQRLDIKERAKVNVALVPERVPSISIKVPKQDSGTSSSSESEDEREIKVGENVHQVTSPIKPPTALKPNKWPVIDLAKVPKVKHRLDIKTTVPASEASDSNSEDERVKVNVTQVQGKLPSTAVSVQKPESGTSSSSDSEDEREIKIATNNLQQISPPAKQPSVESPWPIIDLVRVPKVKRCLDIKERVHVKVTQVPERVPSTIIKIPKPESGTSSSSESEDEREIKIATNNLQQIAPPAKQPIIESPWPVIDLVRIPKVERRLDIKERVNGKHAPDRVPSTSIKVPKPNSGTSSSSESEDEREIKVKVNQENLQQTISPIKPPIALMPHQESHSPVNLVKVPKVKRRLDIKTIVPASESSSSDSESEIIQVHMTQVQGKLPSTPVNVQKPESGTSSSSESDEETPRGTEKPDLNTRWPMLDLKYSGKLKKRLDFKVKSARSPKLPSGSNSNRGVNINVIPMQERVSSSRSSSSSEDERETTEVKKDNVLLVTSPIRQPSGVSQRPVIDPIGIPKLKQRLDIRHKVHGGTQGSIIAPSSSIKVTKSDSGTSSSSESEEEREIKIANKEHLQQITSVTKQPTVESPWPLVNLVTIPKLKQRLDIKERVKVTPVKEIIPSTSIKLPKPGSSSSSESEDQTIQKVSVTTIESRVEPQTQWPTVDPRGITRIKRRLDFKIPSRSPPLSIPSSGGSRQTLPKDHRSSSSSSDEEENAVKSSQISVGQTTIKGTSMKPGLHESSSSSDDENGKPTFSNVSVKSQDKHFIKVSPMLSSPTKNTRNIELEKYEVVTDDLRNKSSSGSASVTPELQSKWATMNLGHSRFRKRLDITKTSSPSSPPPNSPKQIISFDMPYTKSIIVTKQVATAPPRERNVDSSSSSSENEDDLKLGDKTSRVEVDFGSPQVSLSRIPKVKRSLNVTKVQKKSSSSSSDEDTVNITVPDLSAGIPRVKRRLYIKAPTPPPSSSSSDEEKVYAHKFSDVTDQRSIEYKRTIMKSSTYDSFASNTQWQSQREPLYVGSNTQTPKKLSLDNIKRKLLPSKQNELPPNLRWTSVGSHLPEHPVLFPKRHQDVNTSPQPMSSPPPMPTHDSSDSSSSDDEKKEVKTTLIVTQKTYNPRGVTFNTSPTILTAVNFEDGPERRGLSALKAMSSDRKNWESNQEIFRESVPVSVDYHPEVHTVYRRTVDAKTKMSQAQSYSVTTSSPATEERRLADMTYGIPGYRRHIIRSTETPEDSAPPVPSTPLPEESPDFTWRSPQSSLSKGNLGYYNVQQKTTVEESVDDPFYDNPNISAV